MSTVSQGQVRSLPVPGHPNYRITNTGEIWRRLSGIFVLDASGVFRETHDTWRKLTPCGRGGSKRNNHRYLAVTIARRTNYIHRMVLEAFVGPQPTGAVACHCDGNRMNNHVSNLRWDTPFGNHRDAIAHGTIRSGERHPMAKITEVIAQAIRDEYAGGVISQGTLATKYGVSQTLVGQVVRGVVWRHAS